MTMSINNQILYEFPLNTGLEVICDTRSGSKLELVLPVFNEENRIANIIKYYCEYDLVFMDGGSTDRTIEIAVNSGASVFKRNGDGIGENHFVHYVNVLSKSGYCFYMMADEFVRKSDLDNAVLSLQKREGAIFCRKIEWFYGTHLNADRAEKPRGICKGDALYNPNKLHDSLLCVKERLGDCLDIHHLHVWSMQYFLGQSGKYAYIEVEQSMRSRNPMWTFFRRFFVSELILLPRKLWRQRSASVSILFLTLLIGLTMPLIGLLCLVEIKYLLTPKQQMNLYSKFYV
jgi:glycosyltransferase involved in cell wall biosynthesis